MNAIKLVAASPLPLPRNPCARRARENRGRTDYRRQRSRPARHCDDPDGGARGLHRPQPSDGRNHPDRGQAGLEDQTGEGAQRPRVMKRPPIVGIIVIAALVFWISIAAHLIW